MSSVYFPPRTEERTFLPLGLLQPRLFKHNIKVNVQKVGWGGMGWIAVAYGRDINAA
jgi:hypothetical protein